MQRRDYIAAIGVAAVAWPLAASAQQAALPTVGFLHSGSASGRANLVAAFQKGLEETGQIVGRNFQIGYAWGDDQPDRLCALAADLVRRK
jgi:putative ABC transport system substrate-binding protein